MRPNIFVIGYPRSGTTWLCRLIADAWNCPIGSIHSKDIFHGHPAEGRDRMGPFVVLHGHNPPHKVDKGLGDFLFFIYRDPRDLIVSISHYFKRPLDECIDDAIDGRKVKGPLWFPIADYVTMWLESDKMDYATQYERLHEDAIGVLAEVELTLKVEPSQDFGDVVRRQSFSVRRNGSAPDRDYHLRHMRKGIIGDWKNHFSVEQLAKVQYYIDGMGYW